MDKEDRHPKLEKSKRVGLRIVEATHVTWAITCIFMAWIRGLPLVGTHAFVLVNAKVSNNLVKVSITCHAKP